MGPLITNRLMFYIILFHKLTHFPTKYIDFKLKIHNANTKCVYIRVTTIVWCMQYTYSTQRRTAGNTQKRRHKIRSSYGPQTVRFQREAAIFFVRAAIERYVNYSKL